MKKQYPNVTLLKDVSAEIKWQAEDAVRGYDEYVINARKFQAFIRDHTKKGENTFCRRGMRRRNYDEWNDAAGI